MVPQLYGYVPNLLSKLQYIVDYIHHQGDEMGDRNDVLTWKLLDLDPAMVPQLHTHIQKTLLKHPSSYDLSWTEVADDQESKDLPEGAFMLVDQVLYAAFALGIIQVKLCKRHILDLSSAGTIRVKPNMRPNKGPGVWFGPPGKAIMSVREYPKSMKMIYGPFSNNAAELMDPDVYLNTGAMGCSRRNSIKGENCRPWFTSATHGGPTRIYQTNPHETSLGSANTRKITGWTIRGGERREQQGQRPQ